MLPWFEFSVFRLSHGLLVFGKGLRGRSHFLGVPNFENKGCNVTLSASTLLSINSAKGLPYEVGRSRRPEAVSPLRGENDMLFLILGTPHFFVCLFVRYFAAYNCVAVETA
jgi:hypothetical protein